MFIMTVYALSDEFTIDGKILFLRMYAMNSKRKIKISMKFRVCEHDLNWSTLTQSVNAAVWWSDFPGSNPRDFSILWGTPFVFNTLSEVLAAL